MKKFIQKFHPQKKRSMKKKSEFYSTSSDSTGEIEQKVRNSLDENDSLRKQNISYNRQLFYLKEANAQLKQRCEDA